MEKNIIKVYWRDNKSNEIIFIDKMLVKDFKEMHGKSPHITRFGIYHDVNVEIDGVKNEKSQEIAK